MLFRRRANANCPKLTGKAFSGINVVAIDKHNSVFGGDSTAKNENFRACGYVSKAPSERGYLYWLEGKSKDTQEARMFIEMSAKKSSEAINYSVDEVAGIGEEAKLSRSEMTDSKHLAMAVRKEKTVFLITISKPLALATPV